MSKYNEAAVSDRFKVGKICRQTGHYKHTGCNSTEIYLKGNEFVPCGRRKCPHPGAEWELWEILTFNDIRTYL